MIETFACALQHGRQGCQGGLGTGSNDLGGQDGRHPATQALATNQHRNRVQQQGHCHVDRTEDDHVPAQRAEHAAAGLGAHREYQCKHAERCRPQHPMHDHDHHIGDGLEEFEHALMAGGIDAGQGKAEEQREHDQRQHGALRGGGDGVAGNDGCEPVGEIGRSTQAAGGGNRGTQVVEQVGVARQPRKGHGSRECGKHAASGEQQRKRDQGAPRDASGCGGITGGADPDDDQCQHQRHHGHLQGIQPQSADGLGNVGGARGQCRIKPSEQQADECAEDQPKQYAGGIAHVDCSVIDGVVQRTRLRLLIMVRAGCARARGLPPGD